MKSLYGHYDEEYPTETAPYVPARRVRVRCGNHHYQHDPYTGQFFVSADERARLREIGKGRTLNIELDHGDVEATLTVADDPDKPGDLVA